jgi:FMN phosphatase YigB (HAD superfamily)
MPHSLKKPKFVYFDLGNVLLHFDHHRAARQMAEVAGIEPDVIWKTVFESDLQTRYECGAITTRQFYDHFCATTKTQPDFDALCTAAADIFTLNCDVGPIVSALATAGIRLGVLSNTCEVHWKQLYSQHIQIGWTFELYALSYQIGAMKPQLEIYLEAAKIAGVAPEEIFYCDDRPENVEGALRAGFDAVLYETPERLHKQLRDRGLRFNY